jgi:hypothetical protein
MRLRVARKLFMRMWAVAPRGRFTLRRQLVTNEERREMRRLARIRGGTWRRAFRRVWISETRR